MQTCNTIMRHALDLCQKITHRKRSIELAVRGQKVNEQGRFIPVTIP